MDAIQGDLQCEIEQLRETIEQLRREQEHLLQRLRVIESDRFYALNYYAKKGSRFG